MELKKLDLANLIAEGYRLTCKMCTNTWDGDQHKRFVNIRRIYHREWIAVMSELFPGLEFDTKSPYQLDDVEIGLLKEQLALV